MEILHCKVLRGTSRAPKFLSDKSFGTLKQFLPNSGAFNLVVKTNPAACRPSRCSCYCFCCCLSVGLQPLPSATSLEIKPASSRNHSLAISRRRLPWSPAWVGVNYWKLLPSRSKGPLNRPETQWGGTTDAFIWSITRNCRHRPRGSVCFYTIRTIQASSHFSLCLL